MKTIYITIACLSLILCACTGQGTAENRNPNTADSKVEIENASVPSPMK